MLSIVILDTVISVTVHYIWKCIKLSNGIFWTFLLSFTSIISVMLIFLTFIWSSTYSEQKCYAVINCGHVLCWIMNEVVWLSKCRWYRLDCWADYVAVRYRVQFSWWLFDCELCIVNCTELFVDNMQLGKWVHGTGNQVLNSVVCSELFPRY